MDEVFQPVAGRSGVNETFQEYAARLLSLATGKDPLAVLAATPGRIGTLIAGRGAQDLQWTTAPSRWSIAHIVAPSGRRGSRERLSRADDPRRARYCDPGVRPGRMGTRDGLQD